MNDIVGLQPVVDIIALALQSSFVANEKNGCSIVLVSKPEACKTTAIFKFNGLKHVSYYDEITQKKLIDEFLPFVRNKQKRTLMIPDLINCTEKQRSTRDQFLNIIKSGTDDNGIVQISTAFKLLSPTEIQGMIQPLRFNLITAITSDSMGKIEKFMKQTGLQSRLLFFSYDYPISLIQRVMAGMRGEELKKGIVKIPTITTEDTIVQGDADLFKGFEMLSSKIAMRYEGFGIRAQSNLQRLAKANALLNKRKKVKQEDIDKVIELSNWINLSFNTIGVTA